jgi:hypothetical protein
MISSERRLERSLWASEALYLQLQQAAQQFGLSSMALTDSAGNLWASSTRQTTPSLLAQEMSQLGLIGQEQDLCHGRRGRISITVSRLQVGPAVLYLGAQGARKKSCPALEHARPGVARILATLLH